MKRIQITFEKEILPEYAFNLDLAGNLIDNLPAETGTWFFRFTVCVGTINKASASDVLRHCKILKESIVSNMPDLRAKLAAKPFDDALADEMIRSWQNTLREIIRLATNKDWVSWTGDVGGFRRKT